MDTRLLVTTQDNTRLFVRVRGELGSGHLEGEAASPASISGEPLSREPQPAADRLTAILCDGIACDGFIWKYLWNDVAPFARVVHWNYRGHGRSSRPGDPRAVTLLDHAKDLDAVRRAVGDGPVVLFGHSMGCQVALEGLRLRPDRVAGLVLICGSFGRVTHTFKGTDVLAQVLPRLIEAVDRHPHLARGLWGNLPPEVALRLAILTGEVDKHLIVPEDLLPYMRHMVDIDLPMFLRMLRSAGEHTALDFLPDIRVPVLVISGDRDTFTPPRYAEQMASSIPNAELRVLHGTHVIPLEHKDEVARLVGAFLTRVAPATNDTAAPRAPNPEAP